jgi:hypothetical protein
MPLVFPYLGKLNAADLRLRKLAEFLGIAGESLALPAEISDYADFVQNLRISDSSSVVVNLRVMEQWLAGTPDISALVAALKSRFRYLIVHAVEPVEFDGRFVAALSDGALTSVGSVRAEGLLAYSVLKASAHICQAFAGITFGPVDPTNDLVLRARRDDPSLQSLITISGQPFFALHKSSTSDVLFIASRDVVDLDSEADDTPLAAHFSKLMPHAMALRYAAGSECWRPAAHHACVVIDDPLLHDRYGFLRYEHLLSLARKHNFHASTAFIPHNFNRTAPHIAKMFRENPSQLSICFHGNDHTGEEFACNDPAQLHTMLQLAEDRISRHNRTTGVLCDRVMVFPQGNFSVEAMKALKCRNFHAAVNTISHPTSEPLRLTIREIAQPAVLRYGGFPLFIRKPVHLMQSQDIAFNMFFGRPLLIVEHHEVFALPEAVALLAESVNAFAPQLQWSNLDTVVRNSFLVKRTTDGMLHLRAYSHTVDVANHTDFYQPISMEWPRAAEFVTIERVSSRDKLDVSLEQDQRQVRMCATLPPRRSQTFSVVARHPHRPHESSLGFGWNTKAVVRRRLSEIRDNYLARNPHVLRLAKLAQRLLFG